MQEAYATVLLYCAQTMNRKWVELGRIRGSERCGQAWPTLQERRPLGSGVGLGYGADCRAHGSSGEPCGSSEDSLREQLSMVQGSTTSVSSRIDMLGERCVLAMGKGKDQVH